MCLAFISFYVFFCGLFVLPRLPQAGGWHLPLFQYQPTVGPLGLLCPLGRLGHLGEIRGNRGDRGFKGFKDPKDPKALSEFRE